MRLYRVKAREWQGWDTAEGFVVAAADAWQARQTIAHTKYAAGYEGKEFWMEPSNTWCTMVARESIYRKPQIVLRSFCAG